MISRRSHQLSARARAVRFVEAVKLAEEDELVDDLHLLVEAALFRQVADAMKRAAVEGFVEERDRAGVGHGHADHHADGGGFAGAVGAEQAEHRARLNGEREAFDRDFRAVDFADVVKFDDGHARWADSFRDREVWG